MTIVVVRVYWTAKVCVLCLAWLDEKARMAAQGIVCEYKSQYSSSLKRRLNFMSVVFFSMANMKQFCTYP